MTWMGVADLKRLIRSARAKLMRPVRAVLDERLRPTVADVREAWVVPVSAPMILVSQVHRSGGTLMGRLFDGHLHCCSHPHELQWASAPRGWPTFDAHASARDTMARLEARWIAKSLRRGHYRKSPKEPLDRHPFLFDPRIFEGIFRSL